MGHYLTSIAVDRLGENCYTGSMRIVTPGADLCLTYVNSLSWRGRAEPLEALEKPEDLRAWLARETGLGARLATPPSNVFAQSIGLRESLYRLFTALSEGSAPRVKDFVALQRALRLAPPRDFLIRIGSAYGWRLVASSASMPELLAPILWSAGDLLASSKGHRLRQCANPECLWLFRDDSRNRTRRWCDMASCGNRAKARRHYARIRQI